MMRCGALFALCTLLAAAPAAGQEMTGRYGVGGASTLGGVTGLDVIYWMPKLALNGTVDLYLESPENGDSGYSFKFAMGALFPLARARSADVAVGGRLDIGIAKPALAGADSAVQLTLEVPLRGEWYLSEHFSLHAEVGLAIELIPEEGRVFDAHGSQGDSGGTGVIIGGTEVLGGAGFTFYF